MEMTRVNSFSFSQILQLCPSELKERIYQELLMILQRKIYQYTGGNSSVSQDIAQVLMNSIEHTISFYFHYLTYDQMINLLSHRSIQTIYQESYQYLLESLKKMHQQVIHINQQVYPIPVTIYKDTLRALLKFFDIYNYDYFSQDIVLTLDYPTCQSLKKEGIERMQEYIDNIQTEESFLHSFSKEYVLYTITHCPYYNEDMIDNVSCIVLYHFICRYMHIDSSYSKQQLYEQAIIIYDQFFSQQSFYDYYFDSIKEFSSILYDHIQNHTLDKFVEKGEYYFSSCTDIGV